MAANQREATAEAPTMRRSLPIVAVLLPLAVLVFGIVQAEHHLATSRDWVFDVEGYDPRDLLRGHYIQFQLSLANDGALEECEDGAGGACCWCLTATGPDAPPRVRRATCETAKAQCDGILQTQLADELQRYYIPESDAAELDERFRDAAAAGTTRLRVAIDDEGVPQIEALLVDGEEIRSGSD